MKKLIILVIAIIVVIVIFFLAPKASSLPQPLSPLSATPVPTLAPSPTPFLKLDSSSNLSEEAKKLGPAEFKEDYQKLDQSLSNF